MSRGKPDGLSLLLLVAGGCGVRGTAEQEKGRPRSLRGPLQGARLLLDQLLRRLLCLSHGRGERRPPGSGLFYYIIYYIRSLFIYNYSRSLLSAPQESSVSFFVSFFLSAPQESSVSFPLSWGVACPVQVLCMFLCEREQV